MDNQDYTLSQDTAERLTRMLRWFDKLKGPDTGGGGQVSGPANWQFVRVTGAVVTSTDPDNYYPGQVTLPTEDDDDWLDTDTTCWVRCSAGINLETDAVYSGRQTGNKTLNSESDERLTFVVGRSAFPCSDCIEVVTDVQCVDGDIVLTKKYLRITADGLEAFATSEECDAGCADA